MSRAPARAQTNAGCEAYGGRPTRHKTQLWPCSLNARSTAEAQSRQHAPDADPSATVSSQPSSAHRGTAGPRSRNMAEPDVQRDVRRCAQGGGALVSGRRERTARRPLGCARTRARGRTRVCAVGQYCARHARARRAVVRPRDGPTAACPGYAPQAVSPWLQQGRTWERSSVLSGLSLQKPWCDTVVQCRTPTPHHVHQPTRVGLT
jgi:hypothetical protein